MAFSVKPLTNTRYGLGEGPFWDEKNKQLYIVDLIAGDVVKIDPTTKAEDSVHCQDAVGFVVGNKSSDDLFTLVQGNQLCSLKWSTKKVTPLVELEKDPKTRTNDGKCDSSGNLWAGSMNRDEWGHPGLGSLYKVTARGVNGAAVVKQFSPVILSNGLAWSNDDSRMFYVDSAKRVVYYFKYDKSAATISEPNVFFNFAASSGLKITAMPDGLTIDADGKLWIACFSGGRVLRVDTNTAQVVSHVEMPTTNITSACWGGPDLKTLFVTSANSDMNFTSKTSDPSGHSMGGAVFEVVSTRENIRGTPSQRFNDL